MKLKDIDPIPPKEHDRIINYFNDTAVTYSKNICVYDLFREQVITTPNNVAIINGNKKLSYFKLSNMVDVYCAKLQAIGIQKNDVVAIHLSRSYELIVFQLAVLKAGAVFLPVDKRYPIDRILYMCKDCNVHTLISDELNDVPNINLITKDCFHSIKTTVFAQTVSNNEVCYIIYTSGSTGHPKGCMLNNIGLINFCKNNNTLKTLQLHSNNVFACVNSVSFDYFIAESLFPLSNGYTTVIFSEEESTNQELFFHALIKHQINVLMTTPTRLKLFFDGNYYNLSQLDCICSSGEPLTSELLAKIYEKAPNAQVYNPLGPSECSVWTVGGELHRENGIDIHIGQPIANTQIYILNKYLKPTPIGVTGELCIAGDSVGAGYLNRPELTAEKFIDNPFGKGKLYKTGDLAYWREDGNIVYVGRNDFQVKIRGLRIELGEIENAISSVDGISQAVVIVRKNDEGRQLICAFYTGKEVDAKEIRRQIGSKLPKYMLPHIITHIGEMPLTPSGKINRKALPEVDLYNIESTSEYIPPVTEREKALANILAEILGVEKVGLSDDFFDLGCDSLKAIEFVSACHYEGIYFNLQAVFDHPTISALMQSIDTTDHDLTQYDSFDFEKIHSLISGNTVEHIPAAKETPVGNILLTGATGYLGIHILADFLESDAGTAYCIVRGKDIENSKRRLNEYLRFYFNDTYIDNDRIVVLCGDLTKERFGLSEKEYLHLLANTNTVINSVASVKHYGSYAFFYETNVKSVINLIDFCKLSSAKLIHISTTSVAGNDFDNQMSFVGEAEETHFSECDLYIGQPLDNVYVRSKFEAEKAVLDAMCEGLQANIMRMGNLTNRRSDGKFQRNYASNAFLNRLKAIIELGCIPDYILDLYSEFTPIDAAASAVMTITRHFRNDKNIFHVENTNVLGFRTMLEYLHALNIKMEVVSGDQFGELLKQTENDPQTKHIFETFINDIGKDNRLNYDSPIKIDTAFTEQYLRNLGFAWHETDLEYLTKYFAYFKQIGYIGGSENEE